MFVTAILAAAGQSSRMNTDKLLLPYKGSTVFQRALSPLVSTPLVTEVVAVVSPDSSLVADCSKCRTVVNEVCAEGMGTSIRAGVLAASSSTDVYLIALADMPELSTELVEMLLRAYAAAGKTILVPFHEGRNGHPVLFSNAHREELAQLVGDAGARSIVQRHAAAVERFETDNRAVLFDVDTPEQVRTRRVGFSTDEELHRATEALHSHGVWFTAVDDSPPNGLVGLSYCGYDDSIVRSLCPDGVAVD